MSKTKSFFVVLPEKHKAFAQGFYFFVSLQKSEANIRGNKFCANKQVKETKVRKFIVFENRLFPLFVRTFCCLKKKLFLKLFFDHGGQGSVKKKLFRLRIFFLLLVYLRDHFNMTSSSFCPCSDHHPPMSSCHHETSNSRPPTHLSSIVIIRTSIAKVS